MIISIIKPEIVGSIFLIFNTNYSDFRNIFNCKFSICFKWDRDIYRTQLEELMINFRMKTLRTFFLRQTYLIGSRCMIRLNNLWNLNQNSMCQHLKLEWARMVPWLISTSMHSSLLFRTKDDFWFILNLQIRVYRLHSFPTILWVYFLIFLRPILQNSYFWDFQRLIENRLKEFHPILASIWWKSSHHLINNTSQTPPINHFTMTLLLYDLWC